MSWVEGAKRDAVLKAIEPVRDGWIIGLGSGSTVAYAVKELARLRRDRRMEFSVVPTSYQIEYLANSHGLKIVGLNEVVNVDYAIDGADQIQHGTLNMMKGGGGALMREKIVDSAAHQFVAVVDQSKLVKLLGGRQPVPLEVLPFACKFVQSEIAKMGGRAKLRESVPKVGPVVTDNCNFLLDADFGKIHNAALLDRRLRGIPGILETGLFIQLVDRVYVGCKNEVKILKPSRHS